MSYKPIVSVRVISALLRKGILCVCCYGLLSLCGPQTVLASFTDSLTIGSAKALSLGHAVTADPPNIDSIHFNPAGLIRLKGRQMHLKAVVGKNPWLKVLTGGSTGKNQANTRDEKEKREGKNKEN